MTPIPAPTRRHCAIAATLAAVALATGACGPAQTDAQYQAGVGANVRTGPIQLYNALAVTNGDGTATVSVTVLNRTDQSIKLASATGRLSDGKKVSVQTSPAIIGAGQAKETGPAGNIVIKASKITAGQYVKLALRFTGENRASVDAPIVARSGTYDEVATGPGGQTETPRPTAGTATRR